MLSGALLRKTDVSGTTPNFVFDLIADLKPLKELTTPEQFADVILFFLLPWSRALTG